MPKDILAHVTDMVDEGCRVCRRVQAEGIQVLSLITRDPHSLTELASAQEREKWSGAVEVRNMPSCMHTCTHSVSCCVRASLPACLPACLSACLSVCLSVIQSVHTLDAHARYCNALHNCTGYCGALISHVMRYTLSWCILLCFAYLCFFAGDKADAFASGAGADLAGRAPQEHACRL